MGAVFSGVGFGGADPSQVGQSQTVNSLFPGGQFGNQNTDMNEYGDDMSYDQGQQNFAQVQAMSTGPVAPPRSYQPQSFSGGIYAMNTTPSAVNRPAPNVSTPMFGAQPMAQQGMARFGAQPQPMTQPGYTRPQPMNIPAGQIGPGGIFNRSTYGGQQQPMARPQAMPMNQPQPMIRPGMAPMSANRAQALRNLSQRPEGNLLPMSMTGPTIAQGRFFNR